MAAMAIRTNMKMRNHDIRSVLLFAESVAAESVPRMTGHSDECRKRPITDLKSLGKSLKSMLGDNIP